MYLSFFTFWEQNLFMCRSKNARKNRRVTTSKPQSLNSRCCKAVDIQSIPACRFVAPLETSGVSMGIGLSLEHDGATEVGSSWQNVACWESFYDWNWIVHKFRRIKNKNKKRNLLNNQYIQRQTYDTSTSENIFPPWPTNIAQHPLNLSLFDIQHHSPLPISLSRNSNTILDQNRTRRRQRVQHHGQFISRRPPRRFIIAS